MRQAALAILFFVTTTLLHAASGDPLADLRFSDGKARTFADFPKQGVIVVYFCGHCPTAAAYLGKTVKALYDYIETTKVPVTLVLANPEFGPAESLALNKDRGYHMDHALWASDPKNPENISLKNVYQVSFFAGDHRQNQALSNASPVPAMEAFCSSKAAGEFRYPADGLSDPRVKEVWWEVERQRPDAVRNLVAAAKAKSPVQGELQGVVATVTASLTARQDGLVAAPVSLATYEALETLLGEGQGLDLKPAAQRLKELGKDKILKPELDARSAWRSCQTLLASTKPADQAAGKAGLPQIAKRFPTTVYGQRAAESQ